MHPFLLSTHRYYSLEIPQDIIDSVIAAVGEDTRLLKKCALVSSSFLLPSRKQLFSKITVRNRKTCQRIRHFLAQNPILQSSVRSITLDELRDSSDRALTPKWINGRSLPAFLRLPFPYLECFSINYRCNWDWNRFSSQLKDALSNIIHLPNLKTLSLLGITKVPTTFFLDIVHLTTLELSGVSESPIDSGYEISSSLTRASNGEAPKISHVVVDRLIWDLNSDEITRSTFLPFMCCLRFFQLEISVYVGNTAAFDFGILSFLIGSLSISLTSPPTLEHLKFNILFFVDAEEFQTGNDLFYELLRGADVWSHLDSIATHPSGSRLQRVDINIRYNLKRNHDEDKVIEAVLDALPLLRTKDILFVEAFNRRRRER